MSRLLKYGLIVIAILILGLGITYVIFINTFDLFDDPEKKIVETVYDYEGLRQASIYNYRANTLTMLSIGVSVDLVSKTSKNDSKEFVVFSAYPLFDSIEIKWISFDTLQIIYPNDCEIITQTDKVVFSDSTLNVNVVFANKDSLYENKINRLINQIENKENTRIKIDSINSGISINLKEIKELRDSIEIAFDGYFYGEPVTLIHNRKNIFQDTLRTEESMGFSTDVRFKRGLTNNKFILLLEGKKYEFVEDNKYNFIHISDTRDGFSIVYTNKGYVYD
jgi:hypothetical protein